MKLIGKKYIFTVISKLLKRSFARVHPEDPQPQQPESSDCQPTRSLLRHLKITKFKINCAKDFGTEKQVIHYCTKYLKDFPTSYKIFCDRAEAYCELKKYSRAINDLNSAILLKPERSTAWYLRDLSKAKCRDYCYYQLKSYEEALCDLKIFGCGSETTYINKANIIQEFKKLNNSSQEYLEDGSNNGGLLSVALMLQGLHMIFTTVKLWKKYFKLEILYVIDIRKEKKERVRMEPNNLENLNNNCSQSDNEINSIIDEEYYIYDDSNGTIN
ncbi:hypothetical protein Glove_232g76 [Diversispora epigaea]|uniref:Uncharacterized protein n=1 Tax=Diversispora epigaea TaxID=1348612 RepID=A0A397IIY5_9GLOM|nr:hypothetical protein Glove_232g76 [Diversispora epigaea]